MSAESLRPGIVLLAEPTLQDPYFEESAVLLCAHDEQRGSLGLVLNRPTDLAVAQVLPSAGPLAMEGATLGWGGPVALDRLHALHGSDEELADSFLVCPGVGFGGREEDLARVKAAGRPVRLFLGYAGWDAGQLEAELESRTWRIHPGGAAAAFDPDPATLWQRLLGALDASLRWIRHRPGDPERN